MIDWVIGGLTLFNTFKGRSSASAQRAEAKFEMGRDAYLEQLRRISPSWAMRPESISNAEQFGRIYSGTQKETKTRENRQADHGGR